MNIAEQIKEQITMLDVVEKYGFSINNRNFMLCPFHNEKTPSFKVYADFKKWKCFGCGEGGSVIDFVGKLYNLNFIQSCERLNYDFGLNLKETKTMSRQEKMEYSKRLIEVKKQREADKKSAERLDLYYIDLNYQLDFWHRVLNANLPEDELFHKALKKISEINIKIDIIETKRGEVYLANRKN